MQIPGTSSVIHVDHTSRSSDFPAAICRIMSAAAERFLAKPWEVRTIRTPRVINTDKYAAYPPAIVQLKGESVLEENCQHQPVQYLKRPGAGSPGYQTPGPRKRASQHFRSFWGA
jgi:transposase-like protein